MKLQQVLSSLNQIEKSKFINNLDKLFTDAEAGNEHVTKTLEKLNRQIKDASGSEITQLFQIVSKDFQRSVKEQLSFSDASKTLMADLAIRTDRLGTTLDDRISVIFDSLNSSTEHELNAISIPSYKEMYIALEQRFSKINEVPESLGERLKRELELEGW